MGIPQGPELLIILVVILLLFGGSKLPGLARSMGQSARELRKGFEEEAEDNLEGEEET
jgi:sec-independent protein translocase protein TatA